MYIFAPYNLIMCCMVKKWIFPLLIGVCLINTSMAQENPILLFPKGAPGETIKLIEKADTDGGKTGGESVLRITNVSEPTITIYHAPDEVASGAAMIVCPGGGYNILAYDLEGDEVCEWLNNLGITAVLLNTGFQDEKDWKNTKLLCKMYSVRLVMFERTLRT